MQRLFKKSNSENGAVTVEATIALTSFLFMFIMIYSIVTCCRAQAQIQVAINATAKEISQYSYIYGLTGLDRSLANFEQSADQSEDKLNTTIGNVAQVFEGIDSIGGTASSMDFDLESMYESWSQISEDLDKTGEGVNAVKQSIEEMSKNPKQLLLGMARLIGSKVLDEAKSRLIAEPVSRALVQKHLKRSNSDTAEACCASLGIVPGTYFGKESYFNGIDFSHSTLFPDGTAEITIVAAYKIRLIQLLPINAEFSITQTAATYGWLHGDLTPTGSNQPVVVGGRELADTIWNKSVNVRVDYIRGKELTELKESGYLGVSNENTIHAYDATTNTFVNIATSNPLYGLDGVEELDREQIKEQLSVWADKMKAATDNRQTIKVKKVDAKGNLITSEVSCTGPEVHKKIILVIPQEEGLLQIYESIISELDTDVVFEVKPRYGGVYKDTEPTTPTQAGGET